MDSEALDKLAAEAYAYGYPMVYPIEELFKHADGAYPVGRPVNVMGYTDVLLGP